ncbi:hypothetical protein [Reyranella sp. CPCC 100927]|uniref:hypothetical protein n=1 Tax=Reyranella sp. CPCC 100927 TaxID=2599616 RepID=UPI002103D808|nr:hypothetical protein [Reyranella sp. CPCC 100927]
MLARDHDYAVTDNSKIETIAKRLEVHPANVMADDPIDHRRAPQMYFGTSNGMDKISDSRRHPVTKPRDRGVNVVGCPGK